MLGNKNNLTNFMHSYDRFLIPVYQRNYDWKWENCVQLLNDVESLIVLGRQSHFVGCIVSINGSANGRTRIIIDGQQRLTTVTLLFLAIYNLAKTGEIQLDDMTQNQILRCWLVIAFASNYMDGIKLKPIHDDELALKQLFKNDGDFIISSNLTTNYNKFCDWLKKTKYSISDIVNALEKLEIIEISLEEGKDDPQLIFESLNSTGLGLTEGDKIRNYILMGADPQKQQEFYEKYWRKIEKCCQDNRDGGTSWFIRDYLTLKTGRLPSKNSVYIQFKQKFPDYKTHGEELLKDLLAYAKRYEYLLGLTQIDKALDLCVKRLNRMDRRVVRPFFLEVLKLYEEGKLSLGDVREIFQISETYLFRRSICKRATAGLNQFFATLAREIVNLDKDGTDNYLEKYKYILLSRKGAVLMFPSDKEFREAFSQNDVYKTLAPKDRTYLFEKLETFGTNETIDVYEKLDEGEISLEHIMPQTLSSSWRNDLGENAQEIHETWLHRVANLTWTAYNQEYSNKDFRFKKTCEHGFLQSGFHLNKYVAQCEKWGEEELKERDRKLRDLALKIWELPETEYEPYVKDYETCTLANAIDFSGVHAIRYKYKDVEYSVGNWKEVIVGVIRLLYGENPAPILQLMNTTEPLLSNRFMTSSEKRIAVDPWKIDSNIYFNTHSSTEDKISILKRLFKIYGISEDELVFYLHDAPTRKSTVNPDGELFEKYWELAIPRIKESNERKCFAYVTQSDQNFIEDRTELSYIKVSCIISRQGPAAVELNLSSQIKQRNKKRFDFLYQHKDTIEAQLGSALIWNRNDQSCRSTIRKESETKSILDQGTWEATAQFHAEWTKKLYDVFIPYLKELSE